MPSSAAVAVVLSDEERDELERWTRRRSSAQGLALRARIVLLAAAGLTNTQIAQRLGISRPPVTKWRRRFAEHRLDGLNDEPRPGRPRVIGDEQVEEVIVKTLESTPNHDEWLLQDLESIGGDRGVVLSRPPSPTIASAVGAQYYWILHVHPVALLGWIALLEGYPPETATIDRMAARTGYPPSAFRTLREHAELDIAHGDELFAVIDRLPLTEDQATIIGLNAMSSVQLLARALDEVTGG